MLAAALRLALLGFSVVPVDRYKRPLGLWKEFQTRRAEAREIEDWYRFAPDAGIGIVTGAISDLVVADIEFHSPWFVEDHDVPMCVSSETQRGGRHFFFTHDPAVRTGPLFDLGMRVGDIKSEGGLVVVPPSEGRAGSYRWLAPPWERPLAEGPRWLTDESLRRGSTAPVTRGGGCGSSHHPGRSRSEVDAHDAVAMLIDGQSVADIREELRGRDAHHDRGRDGDGYVDLTIDSALSWVKRHTAPARIFAVRPAGRAMGIEMLVGDTSMKLHLDFPPNARSERRWYALSAAVGFDASTFLADLTGMHLRVELVGDRIGRLGPMRPEDY